MAMVGMVGAGMKVEDGLHATQSRGEEGRMTRDAGALPVREVKTLMTSREGACSLSMQPIGYTPR